MSAPLGRRGSLAYGIVALIGMTLSLATAGQAQQSGHGRLVGTVIDSVFTRRLPGVRVVAVGEGDQANVQGSAITDSAGFYHIDSLPAGRYAVGFESPLLDSLEITLSPREATVVPSATATADLALPPAAKLRAAVCPGVTLPAETGALVGHVVNADDESSIAGATIAMSWREFAFDKAKMQASNQERTMSVVTDGAGWYRVCGAPTGGWLSMQVQHGGRVGPVLRSLIGDTLGIAVRHVSFSPTSARPAPDSLSAAAVDGEAPPMSGTAKLTGVVYGPEGAPVAQAEVRVAGTSASARTDAQGSYALAGLPSGTQMLLARRVGYAVSESYVDLRAGMTTTGNVRLKRVVSLDSVKVVAISNRYPEFARNRRYALFGRFLGPDEVRKQRVSFTSDIIEKLPGFRVIGNGHSAQVVSGRGPTSIYGECPMRLVQNGVPIDGGSINDIPAIEVGAIEAYRPGDFGPPEYDRGCGAIVIWTTR
jgi:hypothetical protein